MPGVNEMIVTQAAAPVYPQPKASVPPPPAPDDVNEAKAEPTAKGGARGLALLASDTAAIILTEQSTPPTPPPRHCNGTGRARPARAGFARGGPVEAGPARRESE